MITNTNANANTLPYKISYIQTCNSLCSKFSCSLVKVSSPSPFARSIVSIWSGHGDKIGFVFVVCLRLILEYDDQGVSNYGWWIMPEVRMENVEWRHVRQPVRFWFLIVPLSTKLWRWLFFCNNCCDYVIKRRPRVIWQVAAPSGSGLIACCYNLQ